MQIYYTNEPIFWCNGGTDYLEKDKFTEYFKDKWKAINEKKSINWETHYSANFYATNTFEATYFKVVDGGNTYYFFVDIWTNNSNGGRFFQLSLDLYYTYTLPIIEHFKAEKTVVNFKRKHCNRYFKSGINREIDLTRQEYLFNIPEYLLPYGEKTHAISKSIISKGAIDRGQVYNVIRSENITYDITDYYDTDYHCYWYLKVKRPVTIASNLANYNFSPFFYFPVKPTYSGLNSWFDTTKWPADYVVELISTAIPPSAFTYGGYMTDWYNVAGEEKIDFFKSQSIILTPTFLNYSTKTLTTSDVNVLSDFVPYKDDYNLDNYKQEIMLYVPPFRTVMINNQPLGTQFVLHGLIDKTTVCDLYSRVGSNLSYFLSYPSFNWGPSKNEASRYCFTDVNIHPYASNTLNEYINNNINSWDTSISLAKQQSRIDTGTAIANGVFGTVMGATTLGFGKNLMGYGLQVMQESNRTFSPGLVDRYFEFPKNYYLHGFNTWAQGNYSKISGTQQMGNSLITSISNIVQSKFNVKSTTASIKSAYLDATNKPPEVTGTFEASSFNLFNGAHLYTVTYALPDEIQKVVFQDFYFNGYVVDRVEDFNTYFNREFFNYFELTNVFQLVSQFSKLPKGILIDISTQLENGIRLWNTVEYNFTMSLNNKERSYA